jgi:hypothetical protein
MVAYPLSSVFGSVLNNTNPTGAQLRPYNFAHSLYGVTDPQEFGHSEPNYEGKTRSLAHMRLLSEEGALIKCRYTPSNGLDSYGNAIPQALMDELNIQAGVPAVGSYLGCRSDGTLGATAVWLELLWWVARKGHFTKKIIKVIDPDTGDVVDREYWMDPCTNQPVTVTVDGTGQPVPEPTRLGRQWIAPWGWWKSSYYGAVVGSLAWWDGWWGQAYAGGLWGGYYGWYGGWDGYYGFNANIPSISDIAEFLDLNGTPPTLPTPCWQPTIHVHGVWGYLVWSWGWQVVDYDADTQTVTVRGGKPVVRMTRVTTDLAPPDIEQYDD